MPEVSVVVELRVAVDEGLEPLFFEQQVAAEGRRAARELYREALGVLDRIAAQTGARQRLEERWVATTFGRIRIWLWGAFTWIKPVTWPSSKSRGRHAGVPSA